MCCSCLELIETRARRSRFTQDTKITEGHEGRPCLCDSVASNAAMEYRFMKRRVVLTALLAAGLMSIAVGAAQQAGRAAQGGRGAAPLGGTPSVDNLQVQKLTDNLYVLGGGGGNTAAFITANGVVLVDTKVSGWGPSIIEKLKTLTNKPVTTIINTHTH